MPRCGFVLTTSLIVLGCASPSRPLPTKPGVATSSLEVRPDTQQFAPTRATQASNRPTESPYVAALRLTLGSDTELSLVPSVQAAVEEALLASATAGAVVALDPGDGTVLGLFSVPGDRGDPLVTPQQPASTFKSFTALAALRAGAITPDTVFTCTGTYRFADLQLTCPLKHGPENVAHALAASCNAFFYHVGAKLDPVELARTAGEFGLASRSGIELMDAPGVVPDPTVKDPKRVARPLVNAIGHGDYLVTLLGLARAYAAIANGGNLVELRVVRSRPGADGTKAPVRHPTPMKLPIDTAALALVRSGLVDAVGAEYGRTHSLAIEGYPFAGKSGGADSPPRADSPAGAEGPSEEDSWFVAYAPPEAPTLLVAARLERITHGNDAARLVARVLAALRAR